MTEFISYDGLPISAGGAHQINSKSPSENYNNTVEFLEKFADSSRPADIHLILYESKEKKYSALQFTYRIIDQFGKPKVGNDRFLKSWSWKITHKKLQQALDILKINENLPKNVLGPLTLGILWKFKFKNPDTQRLLPHQKKIPKLDVRQHNSQMYLRLSKRNTISAWLTFPFIESDKFGSDYIELVKNELPFRPSEKHWRKWKKSEKGNWTPRKLVKNNS